MGAVSAFGPRGALVATRRAHFGCVQLYARVVERALMDDVDDLAEDELLRPGAREC